MGRILDAEERAGLRRLIDQETRRRNLPVIRARVAEDRVRVIDLLPCKSDGCERMSRTLHGRYRGLCDDCIAALGHHAPL